MKLTHIITFAEDNSFVEMLRECSTIYGARGNKLRSLNFVEDVIPDDEDGVARFSMVTYDGLDTDDDELRNVEQREIGYLIAVLEMEGVEFDFDITEEEFEDDEI